MARKMAGWGAALLLVFPQYVLALGLGSIELRSALNQPLSAEIELTSVTSEDLQSLRIEVAPLEAFARYGIDRTAFLDGVRFEIVARPNGTHAVLLTSQEAAREPFLSFLVEARWARGRLLREYTVLLDPPTFMPEAAREAAVAAPRAAPAQPDERSGRVTRPDPVPAPAPAPVSAAPRPVPAPASATPPPAPAPVSATPPPAPAPVSAAPRSAPRLAGDDTYLVQRNDTLWDLANRLRPEAGITINQMMVGLYEANPGAFNGNINRLRAGALLTVPDAAAFRRLSGSEATARVSEQNAAWRGLPAPAPAPATAEPRLVLVAPSETPAAGGASAAAAADASQLRAEVERARTEAERLRTEAAALREQRDEIRRLLELRDAEMAALQQQLADAQNRPQMPVEQPAPLPGAELERIFVDEQASSPAAAPAAVVPEGPVATSAPIPSRVVSTPSPSGPLDTVLGLLAMPFLWISLGLLVVLAAGVLFLKRRRRDDQATGRWEALAAREPSDADVEPLEPKQQMRAPGGSAVPLSAGGTAAAVGVAASVRTGPAAEIEPEGDGMRADEVADGDPIAEADFHLAYGLYDQAAELIDDALAGAPGRSDLRLKLVEIHFVWGHQEGFLAAAKALKEHVGDGAEWDKTLIMARQLCPDEPLFAGQTASGDLDVDFDGGDAGVLSLDFEVDDTSEGEEPAGLGTQLSEEHHAAAEEDLMLNIGMQTATNIEQGMLADDSPTVQQPAGDSPTLETPTLESPRIDDATVEALSPYADDTAETVESPRMSDWDDAATMESAALSDIANTVESPTLAQARPYGAAGSMSEFDADHTAEIDLDDLGLDLEGLDVDLSDEDLELTGVGEFTLNTGAAAADRDDEASTRNQEPLPGSFDDDDLMARTGITQVLGAQDLADQESIADDDATRLAPALMMPGAARPGDLPDDATARANMLQDFGDDEIDGATTRLVSLPPGDFSPNEQGAGDTVEQPRPGKDALDDIFSGDVLGGDGDEDALDLDIGELMGDDDDLTGAAFVSEPETMTEIGTKLDLARAYIDMGDPDGARSILGEVLEEGDRAQQQEASKLLETLGD